MRALSDNNLKLFIEKTKKEVLPKTIYAWQHVHGTDWNPESFMNKDYFIFEVWENGWNHIPLDVFKSYLIQAFNKGLIKLSRLDMPNVFIKALGEKTALLLINKSEILYQNAVFHLVEL